MSTDSFFGEMSCLAFLLFQTVFWPPASCFEAKPSLTRLVKAEIVSLYCGIFINTGLGNPTVPFARLLGNRRVLRLVGGCLIFTAYIRKIHLFTPRLLPYSAFPSSSFSAQTSIFFTAEVGLAG